MTTVTRRVVRKKQIKKDEASDDDDEVFVDTVEEQTERPDQLTSIETQVGNLPRHC